jgi:plasmid stabilization system protein ParE
MSKTYHLETSLQAKADFKSAFRWIEQRAPQQAHKWATGLNKAIESLEQQPARCQLAPENNSFPVEIRQLLYGRRSHRYRILFTIEDDCVNILFIRHYAQDWIISEDE